jgi:hypothetical protein
VSETHYDVVGGDSIQYGPFNLDELRSLVAEGRVNDASRARVAGSEEDWTTVGKLLQKSSDLRPYIEFRESVLGGECRLDLGRAFSDGFSLFMSRPGLLVGVNLALFVLLVSASMFPYIGFLIRLGLEVPLIGGYFILVLNLIRNNPVQFSDLFEGFNRNYGTLLLTGIVQMFIGFCIAVLGVILIVMGGVNSGRRVGTLQTEEDWGEFFFGFATNPLTISGVLIWIVLAWTASILLTFVVPLVADRQFGFFESFGLAIQVAKRNFVTLIAYSIVVTIIIIVSVIPLGLGLLVSVPILYCVVGQAYEQLFTPESNPSES